MAPRGVGSGSSTFLCVDPGGPVSCCQTPGAKKAAG